MFDEFCQREDKCGFEKYSTRTEKEYLAWSEELAQNIKCKLEIIYGTAGKVRVLVRTKGRDISLLLWGPEYSDVSLCLLFAGDFRIDRNLVQCSGGLERIVVFAKHPETFCRDWRPSTAILQHRYCTAAAKPNCVENFPNFYQDRVRPEKVRIGDLAIDMLLYERMGNSVTFEGLSPHYQKFLLRRFGVRDYGELMIVYADVFGLTEDTPGDDYPGIASIAHSLVSRVATYKNAERGNISSDDGGKEFVSSLGSCASMAK